MTKTEARNDKLRAAHDKLQSAVEEIVSGDDWARMLKVASKFHRYSSGGVTYSNVMNSPPFMGLETSGDPGSNLDAHP